jgi:hypothetical protein
VIGRNKDVIIVVCLNSSDFKSVNSLIPVPVQLRIYCCPSCTLSCERKLEQMKRKKKKTDVKCLSIIMAICDTNLDAASLTI